MKFLYTPWRKKYIKSREASKDKSDSCVFCEKLVSDNDKENLILKRFNHSFLVLNRYPYNMGHILVLPNKHTSNLYDLSKEESAELMQVTSQSIKLLEEELKCEGINMGMNKGKPAGGSIPQHVHIHIVPRWIGDTNFMTITADTKSISFNLNEVYERLQPLFNTLEI